ncbi:UTP--glucose-1-phosphate uridylyltransferase [Roseiconus nitratireducens]|uniref:UTP--glucose-1-phosphate uridylyltransferase n=1 Tax=Roseiconus nitratireducens TaxID=2605748 RepID=A0A5M6CUD5_9BACT|nr:UTP--glucose-1-phosphate uridylyltransferase [Roseiconus nitratireducens]KAA5538811.1 UTP--glucose-1-phosphate uridylyltransferase [Roseiconus nitratireducens]
MSIASNWESVQSKLAQAGSPDIVVRLFKRHYENLCSGDESYLRESEIEPAKDVTDAEQLDESLAQVGKDHLSSVAVLKLNGGLGTSMGLAGPKSLLPVRGDDTFLDLILRQANQLSVPLVLMNSFSTQEQTDQAIQASGQDSVEVLTFLQHQVPKIDAQTMLPVEWSADPDLQWCPPGHGDIYAALVTSGTLERLLSQGRRYVFVSNADNLGATLDLSILGHFVKSGKSFLMEVADRTAADRKGGHLARSKSGGLLLREKAQCHPEEEQQFQDVTRYRYFNTNNLWLDLQAISEFMDANDGVISLPTITNRKTVDPKDSDSTPVYQLETAMGAAIEALPNTDAIRVPRSRFAPVKTTGDLLAVRSDAYEVRQDASVGLIAERESVPPTVKLDDRYFKKIADLEARVEAAPSLRQCDSLTVTGNLKLASGIACVGDVTFTGDDSEDAAPRTVPAGTYEGENPF